MLYREQGDPLGESEALFLLGFAAEDRRDVRALVGARTEEALRLSSGR